MGTDEKLEIGDRITRIALDANFATESIVADYLDHVIFTRLRSINLHFNWFPRSLPLELCHSRLVLGFFLGSLRLNLLLVGQLLLGLAAIDAKFLLFFIVPILKVSLIYIVLRLGSSRISCSSSVLIVSPLILLSLIALMAMALTLLLW